MRFIVIILLGFGLVGCSDSRVVSVICDEGRDEAKITFNKISRMVEMEWPLNNDILIVKSQENTPVNDRWVESATLSKLEINENFYEFTLIGTLTEPTRMPGESYEDMYAEYQQVLDVSEMRLKLGRYDLKLTTYINNKVDDVIQCNLIERQI